MPPRKAAADNANNKATKKTEGDAPNAPDAIDANPPAPSKEPATGVPAPAKNAGKAKAPANANANANEPKKPNEPTPGPAAMGDEPSEERSGDQPVVEDDATTAPVPDKVRPRRARLRASGSGSLLNLNRRARDASQI
jgi:hypothetical protein